MSILKTKLYLLTFYKNNQWYRNKDRYGYKRFVVCASELQFYAVIVQKYVLISYDGNIAGPLSRVLIDIESQSWCLWISCFWVNESTATS